MLELYLYSQAKLNRALISLGLIGFAIFITFSKAAYVMAIAVVGIFIYYSRELGKSKTIRRAIIAAIVLLYVGFQVLPIYLQLSRLEEFTGFIGGDINEETTTNRSIFLKYGWDKFKESWLLGEGFDTFYKMGPNIGGTHNQYLLIGGEAGIFALLAYVAYLVGLFRTPFKKYGYFSLVVKSMVIIIAMYSFVSHNLLSNKFVMVFLGLFTAYLINYSYVRHSGVDRG